MKTQQHSTDRKKDNMSKVCAEDSVSWMETGYANTAAPGLMSSVCP